MVNRRAKKTYLITYESRKKNSFKLSPILSKLTPMEIIEITPHTSNHFATINRQWITKYFRMEPIDEDVLSNPYQKIVNPGGAILFAQENEEIIGTVALKKHSADIVELTKMGVYEHAQNRGAGKILIQAAIDKAKTMGFSKIILYSNRKLENAIHLYRKLGFVEFSTSDQLYERCDIQMEKNL